MFAIFDVLFFLSRRRSIALLTEVIERWHYQGRRSLLTLFEVIECMFKFAEFSNEVCLESSQWINDATIKARYRIKHIENEHQWSLQSLSQEQYQVLLCLLKCEYFWHQQTNLLEAYSLPATKESLQEMLLVV